MSEINWRLVLRSLTVLHGLSLLIVLVRMAGDGVMLMMEYLPLRGSQERQASLTAKVRRLDSLFRVEKGHIRRRLQGRPAHRELSGFYARLNEGARRREIQIKGMIPGTINEARPGYILRLELVLNGTYPSLAGYLRELEGEDFSTRVTELSLKPAGKAAGILEMHLQLDVFLRE